MLFRRPEAVIATLTLVEEAAGNSDHNSAIAPVTNGAAALVPPNFPDPPPGPRLAMFSPGALKPCLPIEEPRLDAAITRPLESQATTGMTQG